MLVEGQGPFAAIKRSAGLLKQTWGEQLGGQFGMSGVFFLLAVPGALLAALAMVSGVSVLMMVGIRLAAVYWVVLAVVGSALSQITRAAVYLTPRRAPSRRGSSRGWCRVPSAGGELRQVVTGTPVRPPRETVQGNGEGAASRVLTPPGGGPR